MAVVDGKLMTRCLDGGKNHLQIKCSGRLIAESNTVRCMKGGNAFMHVRDGGSATEFLTVGDCPLKLIAHPQSARLAGDTAHVAGNGGLDIAGDASLKGVLQVTGGTTMHGTLRTGNVVTKGSIHMKGADEQMTMSIDGDANGTRVVGHRSMLQVVSGGKSVKVPHTGNIAVGGDVNISGATIVSGPMTVGSINVMGPVLYDNDTEYLGNVVIKGGLSVEGSIDSKSSNDLLIKDKAVTIATDATTEAEQSGSGLLLWNTGGIQDRKIAWSSGQEWEVCGGDMRLSRVFNGTKQSIIFRFNAEGYLQVYGQASPTSQEFLLLDTKEDTGFIEHTGTAVASSSIKVGGTESVADAREVRVTGTIVVGNRALQAGDYDLGTDIVVSDVLRVV